VVPDVHDKMQLNFSFDIVPLSAPGIELSALVITC